MQVFWLSFVFILSLAVTEIRGNCRTYIPHWMQATAAKVLPNGNMDQLGVVGNAHSYSLTRDSAGVVSEMGEYTVVNRLRCVVWKREVAVYWHCGNDFTWDALRPPSMKPELAAAKPNDQLDADVKKLVHEVKKTVESARVASIFVNLDDKKFNTVFESSISLLYRCKTNATYVEPNSAMEFIATCDNIR